MKKEIIEKEIRSRLDEPDNEWDSIFNNGFYRGFREAANWRINSVWHSATEKPNGKDAYLVENRFSGKIRYCVWVSPFTPVKNVTIYDTIIRWAYIKDLIPDTEE